ncbi:cell division protein FtsQ/DivIB [Actinopolyspora mortivallis]|uniref:POTRA domain-containing protein n=1 Tax=Actinopolyspora mortivallis TaxID=33906 RepID=A0A2T0GZ64_ACTMO|nr:FtsQ-type POTRA domain-containing protein [Actinopolyspora mortivallis]PRW64405.1 hypothetical protein CEP50_05655 [Actinopolyspora mortivallis]
MRESTTRESPGGPRERGRRGQAEPRRRFRAGRWIVLVLLGVVTVAAVLVFFTPVFGVRSVQVRGTEVLGSDRVRQVASVEEGTPLARVDRDGIRRRLNELPRVDSVRIRLVWPSTVSIRLVEREPLLVERTPEGVRLVDDDAVSFPSSAQPPGDLPELRLSGEDTERARRAAVAAFTSLDERVRAQVRIVEFVPSAGVRMSLTEDRTVEWGGPEKSALKAAILPVLLTREGNTYDVTSTELPTVSP